MSEIKNLKYSTSGATQPVTTPSKNGIEGLVDNVNIRKRLEEVLGKRTNVFISSLISATQANARLKECDPKTILSAGMFAATLDLPINQNLGFAYIVPYNNKQKDSSGKDIWVKAAQFQMGYKGFIQLAIRSGQYKTINVSEVYEGEIIDFNRMTGEFDYDSLEDTTDRKIVGYMAYYKLLNGFEKALYMTNKQVETHGKKYSQTYKKGFGLWATDFDAMAKKTVLKLLLNRYGVLSVEMQKSVQADQAIIRKNEEYEYPDNKTDDNILDAEIPGEQPEGNLEEKK